MAVAVLLVLSPSVDARKSWEVYPPGEVSRFRFEWRDEWQVPLSPEVARTIQELIVDTRFTTPHAVYNRSKWSSRIHSLLDSNRLTYEEALSLLWWYRAENSELILQVISDIPPSQLSADWAVVVAVLCDDVARKNERDETVRKEFNRLANRYFRLAGELDADWALPKYLLIASTYTVALDQLPPNKRTYPKLSDFEASVQPSAEQFFSHLRKLLREHAQAKDFRELMPPPWSRRISSATELGDGIFQVYWGVPGMSAGKRSAVGDSLKFLKEYAIATRDPAPLVEVAGFAESFLNYNWSIRGWKATYYLYTVRRDLEWRLWNEELVRRLDSISKKIGALAHRDHMKGWRWRNPGHSIRDEKVEKDRRTRYLSQELRPLFEEYRATLTELKPRELMRTDLKTLFRQYRRRVWEVDSMLWPLTPASSECMEAHPPTIELTPAGEAFAAYVAGTIWTWRGLMENALSVADRAFNDNDASFEQRAAVAFWDYRNNRGDSVVDELEANPLLKESLTPEMAYVMFDLAAEAAKTHPRTSEEFADQQRYLSLARDYVTISAHLDPDWAMPQLQLLVKTFERAIENAIKARHKWDGIVSFDHMRHAGDYLGYISDEDEAALYDQIRAYNRATDIGRLLPPPWLSRISLEESKELVPAPNRLERFLRMRDEPVGMWESSDFDKAIWLCPRFIIRRGIAEKDVEKMAEALRFIRKLLAMQIVERNDLGTSAFGVKGYLTEITEQLANEEKRAALEELADVPPKRFWAFKRLHHWKTNVYELTEEERALAGEAWIRGMERMRQELCDLLDQAIAIVLTLQPEDFREE